MWCYCNTIIMQYFAAQVLFYLNLQLKKKKKKKPEITH